MRARRELMHSYGLTTDWKPFIIADGKRKRYASSQKDPPLPPVGVDVPVARVAPSPPVLPRDHAPSFNVLYARGGSRVRRGSSCDAAQAPFEESH